MLKEIFHVVLRGGDTNTTMSPRTKTISMFLLEVWTNLFEKRNKIKNKGEREEN